MMQSNCFALVTGTSSGVGTAVARALLERGWRVLGVARRTSPLAHDAYEHLQVDLGDTKSLPDAIGRRLTTLLTAHDWRRVGLVNNAADPGLLGQVANLDARRLADVFAVNVSAPLWLMGAFVRSTPPSTVVRIVNVSSGAAVRGYPGLGAYGTSKAALRMAGMVLAAEIEGAPDPKRRDRRISILSYEPGIVDTPMQANARAQSAEVLPSVAMFAAFAAERRLVSPDTPAREIADFLEGDSPEHFAERRLRA
ncbi:MAG TPA: SDR family NAD(P)-dependent oxidoreductase [Gemmatimonadaceae bacterium]